MKTTLSKSNGTIVNKEPFIPEPFDSLNDAHISQDKRSFYETALTRYSQSTDVRCFKITYMSDGLKVTGFIVEPAQIPEHKQISAVIYCRGGSHNDGRITVMSIMNNMYFLATQGYIVLASQYRGNDGGQGKDELGGSDVHDVLNLMNVAQSIEYIDLENVFLFGISRGGMMACMALYQKIPVRAAAVSGCVTDYFSLEQLRPDLIPLFESMMPNMPQDKDHQYKKRSAVCWADAINVPLLLMHGAKDAVIDVSQSQELARKLEKAHKTFKLIIFPEGDHSLFQYRDEVHQNVLSWFSRYKT